MLVGSLGYNYSTLGFREVGLSGSRYPPVFKHTQPARDRRSIHRASTPRLVTPSTTRQRYHQNHHPCLTAGAGWAQCRNCYCRPTEFSGPLPLQKEELIAFTTAQDGRAVKMNSPHIYVHQPPEQEKNYCLSRCAVDRHQDIESRSKEHCVLE